MKHQVIRVSKELIVIDRLQQGKVLFGHIKFEANGKWFLSIICDLCEAPAKVKSTKICGIDVGITHFATLDNGITIENPRFFRESQVKLAIQQRNLSRKKRESKSRKRAKLIVAKMHLHIHNQRLDFARKQASQLFNEFDVICFEELNIKGMIENNEKYLAKSVTDVAWGMFIACLKSKAENAGKWAIGVDPVGTSQECCGCGIIKKKSLYQRIHECSCGENLDRDHCSAKVIKARGQRVVTEIF
jgi:putative transposase